MFVWAGEFKIRNVSEKQGESDRNHSGELLYIDTYTIDGSKQSFRANCCSVCEIDFVL